jgi:hypothetical protein
LKSLKIGFARACTLADLGLGLSTSYSATHKTTRTTFQVKPTDAYRSKSG